MLRRRYERGHIPLLDSWVGKQFGHRHLEVSQRCTPPVRALLAHVVQNFPHMSRVFCSRLRIIAPVFSAIVIGHARDVNPRFQSTATGPIKFIGLMSINVEVFPW